METLDREPNIEPIADQNTNDADPLVSWSFVHRAKQDRSKKWFVVATITLLGLIGFAIWQESYLFALILVLATITFAYNLSRGEEVIDVEIDELGVLIHERFFEHRNFAEFWIAYNPPVEQDLYLVFKNSARPHLIIPLPDEVNPLLVREILGTFIPENLENEIGTWTELLRKRLKL